MNTYKYFFKSDNKKEAVGKINADGLYEAMKKAAVQKRLSLDHFIELFNVEIM